MRRLSLPWKLALASLTLAMTTAAAVLWVFPPGKLDARAHQIMSQLVDEHLGELDQRLFDMDVSGQAPEGCEFTWHDDKRIGWRTYTFKATFQLADYDELRHDWVVTCAPDAQFYAVDLESSYTGAYAPLRQQLVMHRVTDLPGTAGTR